MSRRRFLASLLGLPMLARAAEDAVPAWVPAMRKVHARFTGRPGTLALFGDSITHSLAFWAPLAYERKNMTKDAETALARVSKHLRKECWRDWRGSAYGNQGSMTVRWADDNVDAWLKKLNPETAVILFGTNDLTSVPLDEYEAKLRSVVRRCLANGTVVILTTLPPRSGLLDRTRRFAEAIRRVAADAQVPLCDYFAGVLKRRPDDWDGAAAKWKSYATYEVPTLIAGDGVHPSNPAKYAGDYSAEALRSSGYGLRNVLTLLSYAEVIRHVLSPDR